MLIICLWNTEHFCVKYFLQIDTILDAAYHILDYKNLHVIHVVVGNRLGI
jgi:hypothetical protein